MTKRDRDNNQAEQSNGRICPLFFSAPTTAEEEYRKRLCPQPKPDSRFFEMLHNSSMTIRRVQ
jgi:hypothetical protein